MKRASNDAGELLIYLDPGFLDDIGHYRNFAVNIRGEAEKRNISIEHFVNCEVSAEAADEFLLKRVFKYKAILLEEYPQASPDKSTINSESPRSLISRIRTSFAPKPSIDDSALPVDLQKIIKHSTHNSRVLASFSEKLEAILDDALKANFQKITVYMYTSHPLYFPVVAALLNLDKFKKMNIKCHLGLFYLNLGFCKNEGDGIESYKAVLHAVSNALTDLDPSRRIQIHADSEKSIKLYEPFFKRGIKLYPIPLTESKKPFIKSKHAGNTITVGYFGYAHPKQGYILAKQLYMNLSRSGDYSNVNFIVRHHTKFSDQSINAAANEFKKETLNITHIPSSVSKAEYDELISACDILLIPHSRDDYPCQTSGSFVDCLSTGKIVIVPADTWMSDILKKYGSGRSFTSGDFLSFKAATEAVLNDFDKYYDMTEREIQNFADFYTADTLFDIIDCT